MRLRFWCSGILSGSPTLPTPSRRQKQRHLPVFCFRPLYKQFKTCYNTARRVKSRRFHAGASRSSALSAALRSNRIRATATASRMQRRRLSRSSTTLPTPQQSLTARTSRTTRSWLSSRTSASCFSSRFWRRRIPDSRVSTLIKDWFCSLRRLCWAQRAASLA